MTKKEALKNLQIDNDTPSIDEIKEKYKLLAKKFHPDLHKNDEDFNKLFAKINESYNYLLKNNLNNTSINNDKTRKYESQCFKCKCKIFLDKKHFQYAKNNVKNFYCNFCAKEIRRKNKFNANFKKAIIVTLTIVLIVIALAALFGHHR